jgi:hypothetical protein
MTVAELTPSQGVELALKILLENGWEKNYYPTHLDFIRENYGEIEDNFEDYALKDSNGAWNAMFEYASKKASDGTITAEFVATQDDGLAHDSETYFVVLSLTDETGTRYFKRDGWYMSYDGGHLEEGEDSEVFPQPATVTEYKESK